jgi:hypothetical protein
MQKKTSGRTRKKGGEERAGGAGGENKLNKWRNMLGIEFYKSVI